MAGNLEGVFAVDYRPLVATENQNPDEAELSFDIKELGTYRCESLCVCVLECVLAWSAPCCHLSPCQTNRLYERKRRLP